MPTDTQKNLAQIQNWMQSVLVSPEFDSANTADFVNDSSRLSAERHLRIYRQSYIARLRDCMKNQFSALAFALGEDLFQMFADQYLEAYPSGSYTLNDLGKNFAAHLQETRPDAGSAEKESWIDFMIELANFEYSLSIIFDEHADEKIVLADDSTTDESLKLIPVFHLFRHTYPVCRYYLDVVNKNEPELPFEETSFCTVSRYNFRLNLLEINPAQYFFLEKLRDGESVAEAKDQTVYKFGFDAKDFENVWQMWRKNFIAADFLRVESVGAD
ncbi:MAG: DNA-binding domain-containing protein [Pyrinomonadaceae bacterium]|nr:DNA-binding domain-containing protein [Pyrinomonadaceae bacterium]